MGADIGSTNYRVQLSDERLRQLTNEQGSALAKRQRQQVLQEAVSMSALSERKVLKPSIQSHQSGCRWDLMVAGSPHGSKKAGWKGKSESLPVM